MLEPFGKGNEKPVFADKELRVRDIRIVGTNRKFVRMKLVDKTNRSYQAICFDGDAYENQKYLEEHKWHITDEKMLIDMNKFYTIIKAEKGQESYPYSETELLYGRILLDRQDATLKKYLDKENAKFQKIKQKMIENQSKDLLEVEKILEYNRVGRESYD